MALTTSSTSLLVTGVHFSGSLHTRAPATVNLPSPRRTSRRTATAAYITERTATTRLAPPTSVGSLYEVLGVHSTATCREIKAAYRRLARVVHPDVNGQRSGYEFVKVHEAYATLSDPERRAHYDLMRRLNCSLAMTSSMAGVSRSGPATRNWETDQCW